MSASDEPGPLRRETSVIASEPALRAPSAPAAKVTAAKVRRSRASLTGLGLVAIVLAAIALYVYVPRLYEVETDDAYIDAHTVSVEAKVAAYVDVLHVNDNSKVAAGDLLVELDPRDFAVAVRSATAELENARAEAANISAQIAEQQAIIAQSEASVAGDRSTLTFAQQELQRYTSLQNTGIGTNERLQQASADIGQHQAALLHDVAALDAAKAHVAVLETQRQEAEAAIRRQEAALAQAQLNLSYTRITASLSGSIANKKVEVGNFVQPGQTLFSLVPDDVYVTANYKETQLDHVRPGQPAVIHIDAFPDAELEGRVDSIQRGTGSEFALLPPENATGNFIKVVQRVPVKITFDDPDAARHLIAPGMSVEATIAIAKKPWWVP